MATKKQPKKSEPDFERARVGQFVDVIAGEYDGLYGAFEKQEDDDLALIRNRDYGNHFPAFVTVAIKDIRPSSRTGGR